MKNHYADMDKAQVREKMNAQFAKKYRVYSEIMAENLKDGKTVTYVPAVEKNADDLQITDWQVR